MRSATGHKSLSASLAFLPFTTNIPKPPKAHGGHKSLSASLAFLPANNRQGLYLAIMVTKAFRLHWHFCPTPTPDKAGIAAESHKSLSASLAFLPVCRVPETDSEFDAKSQKPFGFIGISARPVGEKNVPAPTELSQKPFGFIGISAKCYARKGRQKFDSSQKPFGFIGISAAGIKPASNRRRLIKSQKPFGFIGISALLCLGGTPVETLTTSQKPFGFIGISAGVSHGNMEARSCKSQKPFGFIGISASWSLTTVRSPADAGHKSLSASLAFLPPENPAERRLL